MVDMYFRHLPEQLISLNPVSFEVNPGSEKRYRVQSWHKAPHISHFIQNVLLSTAPVNCTDDEFACASGHQCIQGDWHCDRVDDCADGSDEVDCRK